MGYILSADAWNYVNANHQELIDLTRTLCGICAPSNHEEKRATFCKDWFLKMGAKGVYIDEALNVIWPLNCRDSDNITVFMAHIDTVFPDTEPMPLREEDGKLFCPGVGDNTANVALLMLCAKYVSEKKLIPAQGMLFVMTSGEEGLGNLKGSHALMEAYAGRVKEVYSFDGRSGMACNAAVGSVRYRVEVKTEGGHSYANFGNRNAIFYLSALIQMLYNAPVPRTGSRTSFNVGKISGGTSVNTIAQQAEMLFEYRSDIRENIESMQRIFDAAVEATRRMVAQVNVEVLGVRPCMGEVDPICQKKLEDKLTALLAEYWGITPSFMPSSTDCNIPFSMGIPAICFGGYQGHGAHTREEYIEIESLKKGFPMLLACVLSCL
ncbi:MAG: M20/M25/M40 family metallo-hydrolase [Candidatus Fimivivens sp.]